MAGRQHAAEMECVNSRRLHHEICRPGCTSIHLQLTALCWAAEWQLQRPQFSNAGGDSPATPIVVGRCALFRRLSANPRTDYRMPTP
jgi:hypothetical protein